MQHTSDNIATDFRHQITLSVPVRSTREILFAYLADIENQSRFFPQIEFRLITQGPLRAGSIYHTRQKGTKNWSPYRVLVVEPDQQISAMLTGKDPLFAALRYTHRFIVEGANTVSHETVDYTFRFGFAGRVLNFLIGSRLVRKNVLDAHLKLKKAAENL